MPVAHEFNPDLVLVSAGFDAGEGDSIGECNVSPEAFGMMTHMLKGLADGKLVMVLEGGYNVNTVSNCVVACINSLLGKSAPPRIKTSRGPSAGVAEIIEKVKHVLAPFWKCLRPPRVVNGKPCVKLSNNFLHST